MKKIYLGIIVLLISSTLLSQSDRNKFDYNLDFENVKNNQPLKWDKNVNSGYILELDSTISFSKNYSAKIEFQGENPTYSYWVMNISKKYTGKKITLKGYLKTENVSGGYAGLWMRIDPDIGFDNMYDRGIKGTTDWRKIEISLDLKSDKYENIAIGGILVGKGKVWFDSLEIFIDNEPIEKKSPIILKAIQDKEFDFGSKIDSINPTNINIKNLRDLGLIWGFLKYYHPNIAKGDFNWDYELFRILPKILNAKNSKDRDNILLNWIDKLGHFVTDNSLPNNSLEVKIEPDLDWIENSNFTKELISTLLKIKKAKRTTNHFYISLYPVVGNPKFKNENPYSELISPDTGYKILSLYRYWNIIQYSLCI